MRRIVFLPLLFLFVVGCGDDSGGGTDVKVEADAAGQADAAVVGTATCGEISACQKTCGIDIVCVDTCASTGCSSAQAIALQVRECTLQKCLKDCVSGYDETCNTCLRDACKVSVDACEAHSC